MLTLPQTYALHRFWERGAARLKQCRDEGDVSALLRDDPTCPLALLWRGELRLKRGDPDGACQDFLAYLSLGATSSRSLQLLAELLQERPDFCNSFESYRKPLNRLCIALPVRNESRRLPKALASYAELWDELVIVDTGSTDDTVEIARSFGAKVFRWQWRDDFAAARNECLRHVTADWVFWGDAEHELPEASKAAIRTHLNDPDAQGIRADWRNTHDDGSVESWYPFLLVWRHHPACVFRDCAYEKMDWAALAAAGRFGRNIVADPKVVVWHHGDRSDAVAEQGKRERRVRMVGKQVRENSGNGQLDMASLRVYAESLRAAGRTREAADVEGCFGLPAPVSLDNCPSRENLPELLDRLGLTGEWVEVGTQAGVYSAHLLTVGKCRRLWSVDCWETQGACYRDAANVGQEEQERLYLLTRERLTPFGERSRIVRAYSIAAAKRFRDGSLDFVYLDARHDEEGVMEDLTAWFPKVRKGGILAGHDYKDGEFWYGRFGVKQTVDKFASERGLRVLATRETPPSWFLIASRSSSIISANVRRKRFRERSADI